MALLAPSRPIDDMRRDTPRSSSSAALPHLGFQVGSCARGGWAELTQVKDRSDAPAR
jgi:hypothetical protein